MEYISKDDARQLIIFLNQRAYNDLPSAEKVIPIKQRLQKYIDDPDEIVRDEKKK